MSQRKIENESNKNNTKITVKKCSIYIFTHSDIFMPLSIWETHQQTTAIDVYLCKMIKIILQECCKSCFNTFYFSFFPFSFIFFYIFARIQLNRNAFYPYVQVVIGFNKFPHIRNSNQHWIWNKIVKYSIFVLVKKERIL